MKKLSVLFLIILPIFILGSDDSFATQFLGDQHTIQSFAAYLLWGLIGVTVSFFMDVASSGITPRQFNIQRWWDDNSWRVITSIILVFINVVFSNQLLGFESSILGMFMAGLAVDKGIETINQGRRKYIDKKNKESYE